MTDAGTLDRAFQAIMRHFVETGRPPHYTELARTLGCDVEEGRQIQQAVIQAFFPSWLHPDTDYIVSFPPFHSLPTQYRVWVGADQRWFAQCGFEALAVTWLFPGRTVRVEAPCLDCNERMALEMRDGNFLAEEPAGIIGHMNYPWAPAKEKLGLL